VVVPTELLRDGIFWGRCNG